MANRNSLCVGFCELLETARKVGPRDISGKSERGWQFISVLFVALGSTSSSMLQSALTGAGRVVANIQGWYAQRALIQLAFIVVVAVTWYDRRGRVDDVGAAIAASGALGADTVQ